MSPRIWQDRVQDILDAMAEISGFLAGMTREQFLQDARTVKAVTADLSIIGEAATHVPDDIASAHPEVPWPLMKGMRNHLVHGYFRVDLQVVWDTCHNDLPVLPDLLKEILRINPVS